MPASSSITARAVANGLSRSLAIAACSVPTDRCRVHRSNKINRVVLETGSLVISNDRCDVGCWLILLQKVGGPLPVRNYRIQRPRRMNQSCATGLFLDDLFVGAVD